MIPISVCIITKNESENLEKCLTAIQHYPFEIIVVDTGSTDHSIEIARKYTNKVYNFTWINDFSAARNYAISKASHNMILSIDTDEFIKEIDVEQLENLIESNPKSVGSVKMLNYFEANGETQFQTSMLDRLFNRKYYHYENPIHEALIPTGSFPYLTYPVPIIIDHIGYLGSKEKLEQKAKRDLDILFKELERDSNNPYHYFQIAQCYMLMRDEDSALKYFRIAMQHNPSPEETYTRILVNNYGNILVEHQEVNEALSLLFYYDYYSDNADYLCMMGLVYLHIGQPLKALPEFIKALTASQHDSIDPRLPSYYIGFIYELFGQTDIAKTHYQNCGNLTPAIKALERIS
ncbi:MAG: glycosyltransferase [Lachnospiraceae bacterium]|nr:glycosyltransferase [Lachnospiraceae bacterium]